MNLSQVMSELEAYGSEQHRKTFRRHGAQDPLFGVTFGNLTKLKKTIKCNHALAEELFATGNTDAQTLATMVADPQAMTKSDIERWLSKMNYYTLIDVFMSNVVIKSAYAEELANQWILSTDEWIGRAGWQLVALLALHHKQLSDEPFVRYAQLVKDEVHQRPNRTREAMNGALIAIGIRNEQLETLIRELVPLIGPIHVDHGETNCKTPDPIPYIEKAKARKK
ncbi:DNA alkylation repair protein [Paenibacillus sp. 481]|uniref:DNA alkylation repair protein n=1 Tax=Paenibacillus sp. 481 TaxID=2835869 RepID=UPI001E2FD50B|nr:DNA alkylation repair protein [Paenibacillus sp. 481]UHA74924.1 DNA alkylation repair protein [Paenibacillus sp. 481]